MIVNNNTSETNSITKFVKVGKDNSINGSKTVKFVKYVNSNRCVPIDNIFIHKYRDYLISQSQEVILTDEEQKKYKYRPKLLSYDIYGTVEFWMVLLIINNISSTSEFNLKKIKFIPNENLDVIEHILNKEDSNLRKNIKEPLEIKII